MAAAIGERLGNDSRVYAEAKAQLDDYPDGRFSVVEEEPRKLRDSSPKGGAQGGGRADDARLVPWPVRLRAHTRREWGSSIALANPPESLHGRSRLRDRGIRRWRGWPKVVSRMTA